MATQFECLACGHESKLEQLPARCSKCGHGNGLLRETDEPEAVPPASSDAVPSRK